MRGDAISHPQKQAIAIARTPHTFTSAKWNIIRPSYNTAKANSHGGDGGVARKAGGPPARDADAADTRGGRPAIDLSGCGIV